ncbi:hypothetical protein D3C71_1970660 [compost metagenome]
MNTWEKVDVGYGALNMLKGMNGYVVFRIRIRMDGENSGSPKLLFHAINGEAEVYIDGSLRKTFSSIWPSRQEVEIGEPVGEFITVSVLVRIQAQYNQLGISGPVTLVANDCLCP